MKNILILDDNEPICEVMRDILEMEGYQTTVRMTGKDALAFIENLLPDLVLLDIMLDGGIDGREICRSMKQSVTGTKDIPVIMVSASHDMKDAMYKSCYPNDFISKPFDIYHLVDTVNKQLGSS